MSSERVCRLCARALRTTARAPPARLLARARRLLPLQITTSEADDVLPNKICSKCEHNINSFYEFSNTVLAAEKQLLNLLIQGKDHLQNFYETLLNEDIVKQEDNVDSEQDDKENVFLENNEEQLGDEEKLDEVQIKTEPKTNNEDQYDSSSDENLSISLLLAKRQKSNQYERRYKTATNFNLRSQARNRFETLSYKSEKSDSSAVDPSDLTGQMKRDDGKEYKYNCSKCNKGYDKKTWFIEHENVHTGDKPFECELCGKAYHFSTNLRAHCNTHAKLTTRKRTSKRTSKPNHPCYYCNRRCRTQKLLQRHLKKEHANEPVRLHFHLCDICSKELSSLDHLKKHRKMHLGIKDHVCGTCGKGFGQKYYLTQHERVHTGEKPYVCKECGKGFSQRSTLVIHMRYHTGARPYQCKHCPKSFVCQGLLTTHQKVCTRGIRLDFKSAKESGDSSDSDR